MGKKASTITLSTDDRLYLEAQTRARTIQAQTVNLGYSAEVWTRALLTKHINKFAEEAGHTRLSTISQSKVRTILEEADIKPNKITYYCENRDPDFDQKMHNVLLVYKQLSLQFDEKRAVNPFRRTKITRLLTVIMNTGVLELFLCLPE